MVWITYVADYVVIVGSTREITSVLFYVITLLPLVDIVIDLLCMCQECTVLLFRKI